MCNLTGLFSEKQIFLPTDWPSLNANLNGGLLSGTLTAFKYGRRDWTREEDGLVLAHSITDRELSSRIRRSMKSISNRRWRLRDAAFKNKQTGVAGE